MTTANLLLIGAARSGTTALAAALSQHPDVFFTEPKELHFFAHHNRPATYTGPGDDLMMNSRVVSDPDRFADLLKAGRGKAIRAEGSVSTLCSPTRSIEAIRTFADPDVRLIAMLREPASRAYSSFLYLRGRGHEPIDNFGDALDEEPARKQAGFHHMWLYQELSRYDLQLPSFVEHFGDNLLVLIHEEYVEAPNRALRLICEHLRIDPDFNFQPNREVNRGGEPRSRLVTQSLNTLRRVPALQTSIKSVVPTSIRSWVNSTNLTHPTPEPDVMLELADRLAPSVETVEQILGRKVSAWHH